MGQRKKKKVTSERKKYCHCSPKCNKKLLRKTRRHHYQKIPDNRRHLMRGSESCSDVDLESRSALSPLSQATVSTNQLEGFDDVQDSESMDMQESMDSDGGEGSEAFPDEFIEESEGDGDFGMGHISGGEEGDESDDEGDERLSNGVSNHSEDLDSDDEIKLGGLSDSEDGDSEFDDWKAFDEEELEAEHSDEDALREFEEMIDDEEYASAELWSTR